LTCTKIFPAGHLSPSVPFALEKTPEAPPMAAQKWKLPAVTGILYEVETQIRRERWDKKILQKC